MTATHERATAASTDTPSAWRSAAANGALAVTAGFVLLSVLTAEIIPPVIVMAVLYVVLAVLLRRVPARWPLYVALVLPILTVLGNIPFIVEDVAHPESGAGFIPMVFVLVGVAVTFIAALLARNGSDAARRPVAVGAVAVGLVAVAGSAVATVSLESDDRQDGDVEVVASNVEYPTELRVPAGDVGFYIENEDIIRHTFLIENTSVEQEVPGATDRRVTADLEPGTYRFYCDVAGHEDMEGTLVVE